MKFKFKMMLVILLLLTIWMFYLALKTPTNNANWQTQYKVLPTVEMNGDMIQINNVRDFRYNSNGKVAEARYLN